jgi:hypothetical protein
LSILASENLFKGRHVKNNIRRSFADTQFGMLDRVIESGVKCGEFKPDCDSFHLYLSSRGFLHAGRPQRTNL